MAEGQIDEWHLLDGSGTPAATHPQIKGCHVDGVLHPRRDLWQGDDSLLYSIKGWHYSNGYVCATDREGLRQHITGGASWHLCLC